MAEYVVEELIEDPSSSIPDREVASMAVTLDLAVAAALRLRDARVEDTSCLPTRILVYETSFDHLSRGEAEVCVATKFRSPDAVMRTAARIVDIFDRQWLVISSLRPSVRDQARNELIRLISDGLSGEII